jgi:hypothetical protein
MDIKIPEMPNYYTYNYLTNMVVERKMNIERLRKPSMVRYWDLR